VQPEPDWVVEAWQQPEVRDVFFADLTDDLSKTGQLPDVENLLPVLNRSLPREALQEAYVAVRGHRYLPERKWRDQFARLVPNACPLPPS
jgi:hypothetical protein